MPRLQQLAMQAHRSPVAVFVAPWLGLSRPTRVSTALAEKMHCRRRQSYWGASVAQPRVAYRASGASSSPRSCSAALALAPQAVDPRETNPGHRKTGQAGPVCLQHLTPQGSRARYGYTSRGGVKTPLRWRRLLSSRPRRPLVSKQWHTQRTPRCAPALNPRLTHTLAEGRARTTQTQRDPRDARQPAPRPDRPNLCAQTALCI